MMPMNLKLVLPIATVIITVAVITPLFIAEHAVMPKSHIIPGNSSTTKLTPPGLIIPKMTFYGLLQCNDRLITIPGNSIVVLYYHVHDNVTINVASIYMAFPEGLINETLTELSRLQNPSDALIMGVYVNGRLIAFSNYPGPILSLKDIVSNTYGTISIDYTEDDVDLPVINLTAGDTITVVIYSAVPYALPSCAVTNESEEAILMVKDDSIGYLGQRYTNGRAIL